MRKIKAFTLIELLVVIAIIALLAAILFPVFARARENARRTSCISNLKQIGLGVMQYLQDYDETYPLREYNVPLGVPGPDGEVLYDTASVGIIFWTQLLHPYTKSHQVYYCPSSKMSAGMDPALWPDTDHQLSTMINGNYGISSHITRVTATSALKAAAINVPASKIMFLEFGNQSFLVTEVSKAAYTNAYYLPGGGSAGKSCAALASHASAFVRELAPDCENGRHFEGNVVGYADGHVKWHKNTAILAEAAKGTAGNFGPTTE